jgi:hypothetical protein
MRDLLENPDMSKTKSVGCYTGPVPEQPDPRCEIWVYEAALSLLLAQLIRSVESAPPRSRPVWWAGRVEELRIHATVGDLFFDLDSGLAAADRAEFAILLEEAAAILAERGFFTAEEAANWKVHDDETVIFRGGSVQETGPVAELGRALSMLLRGPLPAPPPGTMWLYGWPPGRSTLAMANLSEHGVNGDQ